MKEQQDQSTLAALLAFFCAVFFTLTIIFAHVSSSSLAPLSTTLSLYALEEYGYILELGFASIGLTQLILAFLLFNGTGATRLKLISLFLVFSGTGTIMVAIFPTLPAPASIVDRLPHIIGAIMQFLFFPLAAAMLSFQIRHQPVRLYTRFTAFITAVFFLVMLFLFISPAYKNFAYFGLIEKIDILAINFWLILISFLLYKQKPGEGL